MHWVSLLSINYKGGKAMQSVLSLLNYNWQAESSNLFFQMPMAWSISSVESVDFKYISNICSTYKTADPWLNISYSYADS